MQKCSFTERKNVLIPNSPLSRPFYDADGNELSGDQLIKTMANMAITWEQKYKKPVPIPEQQFIAWLKQASNLLDKGMSSEEIFEKTLIGGVI